MGEPIGRGPFFWILTLLVLLVLRGYGFEVDDGADRARPAMLRDKAVRRLQLAGNCIV